MFLWEEPEWEGKGRMAVRMIKGKGKLGGDTFHCIQKHPSPFHKRLYQNSKLMLLWQGRQSSAQRACYLPSLSRYPFVHLGREGQDKVRCLAQGQNTRAHTEFELTTLGSWVGSSTVYILLGWVGENVVVRGEGCESSIQFGNRPLMQLLQTAYANKVWLINKTHFKLLEEEFKVELQRTFG